ncbi:MAG: SDR family oxidoreductase, partial [Verrucomicrobia bacterium]|nr:SDR family oxidoreductase [Verrucomicrobiota bacterium]
MAGEREGHFPLSAGRAGAHGIGRRRCHSKNLASTVALIGISDRFAYSASKGAVLAMTWSVARDFLKHDIRCNALLPARTHTPFVDGFARVRCPKCSEELFVPYSCRGRCFCPSCHEKRALEKAGWVAEHVCAEVPHRQFVFTIPKRLRLYFRFERRLLGDLCRAAARTV